MKSLNSLCKYLIILVLFFSTGCLNALVVIKDNDNTQNISTFAAAQGNDGKIYVIGCMYHRPNISYDIYFPYIVDMNSSKASKIKKFAPPDKHYLTCMDICVTPNNNIHLAMGINLAFSTAQICYQKYTEELVEEKWCCPIFFCNHYIRIKIDTTLTVPFPIIICATNNTNYQKNYTEFITINEESVHFKNFHEALSEMTSTSSGFHAPPHNSLYSPSFKVYKNQILTVSGIFASKHNIEGKGTFFKKYPLGLQTSSDIFLPSLEKMCLNFSSNFTCSSRKTKDETSPPSPLDNTNTFVNEDNIYRCFFQFGKEIAVYKNSTKTFHISLAGKNITECVFAFDHKRNIPYALYWKKVKDKGLGTYNYNLYLASIKQKTAPTFITTITDEKYVKEMDARLNVKEYQISSLKLFIYKDKARILYLCDEGIVITEKDLPYTSINSGNSEDIEPL